MLVKAKGMNFIMPPHTEVVKKKIFPPEKFYPRIKIFSNRAKFFCPTLKTFVRLAKPCLKHFPWHFSVAKCFSYCFTSFIICFIIHLG